MLGPLTYTRLPVGGEEAVVMVAVAALAVVPAGQVDTSGFTVTLHKAICALINICREEQRHVYANSVLENTLLRRSEPSSLDVS